jgi:hypothetical protein
MAIQNRRRGCGCCGCFFSLFLFFVVLILVGIGFFYFIAANNLSRVAATGPVSLPAATFNRETYLTARQKFDRFFAVPAERSVTLSNNEVNALLAESPELRILSRGLVVVFDQISAEVYCSLPVYVPFQPRRYLNCTFQLRPAIHAAQLELDISRMERGGRPLGEAEIHQYRFVVVPLIEKTLSNLNMIQGGRSVHDGRIENGNLVLTR